MLTQGTSDQTQLLYFGRLILRLSFLSKWKDGKKEEKTTKSRLIYYKSHGCTIGRPEESGLGQIILEKIHLCNKCQRQLHTT